jgi:hypothetical protein
MTRLAGSQQDARPDGALLDTPFVASRLPIRLIAAKLELWFERPGFLPIPPHRPGCHARVPRAAGIAPWLLGYADALYGITAVAAGAIMMALGWQVLREQRPAERASRNLFAFSILYLFLLFAVLLVERGWGGLIARLAA